MPAWVLQVIIASIPLIKLLIEKLVPDNVTRKREFKTKRKVMQRLQDFRGKTIEEIARAGEIAGK